MSRSRGLLIAALVPFALAGMPLVSAIAEDQPAAPRPVASGPAADASAAAPTTAVPQPTVAPPSEKITAAPKEAAPAAAASQATAAPSASSPPPVEQPAASATAPIEPPAAFALLAELTDRLSHDKTAGTTRDDRDAALKFYAARKGFPLWVSETGVTSGGRALAQEIGRADDYGLEAKAFRLPDLASVAGRGDLADIEATLTLAALKYARFARGGRMDPAALSDAIDRKAQLLPGAKVLERLAAAEAPDAALRAFHPQNPQFEKLRQKYLAVRAGQSVMDAPEPVVAVDLPPAKGKKLAAKKPEKVLSPEALQRKLLANMEMWRWMPTLGNYYIQPNIPEFMVRVVKNGQVIHSERIVVGQTDKMTPIFSDELRLVVFKPFWNVPESIKYKEMMPQLLRGASLEKSGYRADINGRPISGSDVDWNEIDMRQVHIYQPPGASNALGQVKFLFPNKHDVYLHDTPAKHLFNTSVRALSHGCMRVRDPLKLAEVILGADKGWTRAQVDKQATSGPDNTEIKLTTPVPIHITYFTASVDDSGKLHLVNDVYGHENRIQLGLEGKTNLIAQSNSGGDRYEGPTLAERRRYADQKQKSHDPLGNFFKNLFN